MTSTIAFTPVEGPAAISMLTPGTLIGAFQDGSGHARDFTPVNVPSSGTAASAWYPSVISVKGVTWQDEIDIQTVLQYGPVTLVLKAGTADTISNPGMVFTLDQDLSVLTVTGHW